MSDAAPDDASVPPAPDPAAVLRSARDRLDRGHPVIIIDGAPLAGTTRAMYQAARTVLPHARLINVDVTRLTSMAGDPDFPEQFSGGGEYLVWLDDLSPADLVLLGGGVLDVVSPYATVLANINTAWCDRILADRSPVTGPARTVLMEYAERVTVPYKMTPAERTELPAQHPQLAIRESIAEAMVGGDVLVRRLRHGPGTNPPGHALAEVAIDARRCGVHRGLSRSELRQLYQYRQHHATDAMFADAFAWATQRPADASAGLLVPTGGRWKAFSYVAAADESYRGIPEQAWRATLDVLPASDSYSAAVAAHLRDRPEVAVEAFRRAADSNEPHIGAAAKTAVRHLE